MRNSQLRSFHAVALAGNFTKAAELLQVSQPTVTAQVRILEEHYKLELFHRRGRRAILTSVGEELFAVSKQLFKLETEAINLLLDAGELRTGQLRVAAVGPSHVTKMLEAFTHRYPGVQVSVRMGNSQEALDQLLACQADLAILANLGEDPRFFSRPFSRHPVVMFVHKSHPFAGREAIRIRDLEGEPLLMREQGSVTRRVLESAMASAGMQPRVAMEASGREILREAVLQRIGIAAVSEAEYVPSPDLRMVRFSDVEIFTEAHVICLQERRQSRLVSAFFDTVFASRSANA